ncbi:MAG: DUF1859 domain-containing protein, partial [Hyphomicrobium sp.]
MAAPRLAFYPDDWAKYPKQFSELTGSEEEGPRSIKLIVDATATSQEIDLRALLAEMVLSNVQGVKIDNADNAAPVTIQSRLTGDRLVIPGESQAILPWQFTTNDNAFSIFLDSGVGTVVIWLYNTPKPAAVWYTQGAGNVVTVSGTVTVSETKAATSTRTSVAGAAADTAILAANANRKGGTVFNDSTATLYLALGAAAASATDFTAELLPRAYYELPANYTGAVRGIWTAAAGNARVSE